MNNVLSSPFPSNLGGNTNAYESVGGKKTRKTKKGKGKKQTKRLKKKRVSRKKKTKPFLFF